MRITNYYYLMKGWEGNIPIYQYMDLDYLFSLLESKQYFVNRKCHFEDKGESVLPPKSLFGLNSFGVQLNKDEITKMTQEASLIKSEINITDSPYYAFDPDKLTIYIHQIPRNIFDQVLMHYIFYFIKFKQYQ